MKTAEPGNGGDPVPIMCPGGQDCSVAVQASATLAGIHAELKQIRGSLTRLTSSVGEVRTSAGLTAERVEEVEKQLRGFTSQVARSTVDAMRAELATAIKYEVERLAPRGGSNG